MCCLLAGAALLAACVLSLNSHIHLSVRKCMRVLLKHTKSELVLLATFHYSWRWRWRWQCCCQCWRCCFLTLLLVCWLHLAPLTHFPATSQGYGILVYVENANVTRRWLTQRLKIKNSKPNKLVSDTQHTSENLQKVVKIFTTTKMLMPPFTVTCETNCYWKIACNSVLRVWLALHMGAKRIGEHALKYTTLRILFAIVY